jgi:hypothetical protein
MAQLAETLQALDVQIVKHRKHLIPARFYGSGIFGHGLIQPEKTEREKSRR